MDGMTGLEVSGTSAIGVRSGQNAGPNFFSFRGFGDPQANNCSNSNEDDFDITPRLKLVGLSTFLNILPDLVRKGCLDNEAGFFLLQLH